MLNYLAIHQVPVTVPHMQMNPTLTFTRHSCACIARNVLLDWMELASKYVRLGLQLKSYFIAMDMYRNLTICQPNFLSLQVSSKNPWDPMCKRSMGALGDFSEWSALAEIVLISVKTVRWQVCRSPYFEELLLFCCKVDGSNENPFWEAVSSRIWFL